MQDITIVYYTASLLPPKFAERVRESLQNVAEELSLSIVSVSQKPLNFGHNICVGEIGSSIWNLYLQAKLGLEAVATPFVAMCEDDALYSKAFFTFFRPSADLAFNLNRWSLQTWAKIPLFSRKENRIVFSQMIAHTQPLLEGLRERLELRKAIKGPDHEAFLKLYLGEPGRYERQLRITERTYEKFWSPEPTVVFDHPFGLQAVHLAKRKRIGPIQERELDGWGSASELLQKYWRE